VLILDGAGPGLRAALGDAERRVSRAGAAAAAVAGLLAAARLAAGDLAMIVGLVGPGSFTGLRAALAVAHGLALASGRPLVAVAAAEALAEAAPGRPLLAAFATGRQGRLAVQVVAADGTCAAPVAGELSALPVPAGAVLVGPAAAALAALGHPASLLALADAPDAAIVAVAEARLAGRLPPRAPVPLYADDLFAPR
jgi:tRNA threonylcarbamoyladenosine biosynthesis protein TsaB